MNIEIKKKFFDDPLEIPRIKIKKLQQTTYIVQNITILLILL